MFVLRDPPPFFLYDYDMIPGHILLDFLNLIVLLLLPFLNFTSSMLLCSKICHGKATCIFVLLHDASTETERTNLCRQLDGLKLERSYLDGFLSHLQNEVKERLIEEEANLHVYSSNDVDMLVLHMDGPILFCHLQGNT